MKRNYTRKDNFKIVYQGTEQFIITGEYFGRKGWDSPKTAVYTLESGKRILPAHFELGLAAKTGNVFSWMLREFYNHEVIENMIYQENPLFKLLEKVEPWQGKNLVIPIIKN
jgi:hypothetical protein